MTNKRKVYNQLTGKPKRVAVIAKATGLTPERTLAILKQLAREGHSVYRETKAGNGWVKGSGVPPKPAPPPSSPPPPAPKPKPPASWTHPGPLILTASEPDLANGKPGVGCIGRIVVPGVAPIWEVKDGNDPGGYLVGYVAQIEGQSQYDTAFDYLVNQPGVQRAIIGTLGVDPARMLGIGVSSYMVEHNPQPNSEGGGGTWEPYGNTEQLVWQAEHEGWPHVIPSYGVYGSVGLKDYAEYKNQGIRHPFTVYSADGMQDTQSWGYLASLLG